MNSEIDKDFYCAANSFLDGRCYDYSGSLLSETCAGIDGCNFCHRKHPMPEQFRKEYGEDYPEDGAVYYQPENAEGIWDIASYGKAKWLNAKVIVCACTPWVIAQGTEINPDKDWRSR